MEMEVGNRVYRLDHVCVDNGLDLDCCHTGDVVEIKDDQILVESIGRYRRWWHKKYWITERLPTKR